MRPQRPSSASPFSGSAPMGPSRRYSVSRKIGVNTGGNTGGGAAAVVASGDNDVSVLQQQLRSVQQRRAEVDAGHERDMVTFRHRLRKLYNDNAIMRNILSAGESRRRHGGSSGGTCGEGAPATVTAAECEALQHRINVAARKLNMLRHDINCEEAAARERDVDASASQTLQNASGKEGPSLVSGVGNAAGTGGNGSLFLRIQKLEQKLDDVLMQQSTVGVVLRGYEQHLEQLTEESRGYQRRTGHLDVEYAARHRDHAQLVTLFHTAQQEDRRAAGERDSFLRTLTRLRSAKECALAEKSNEVTAALREAQRREQLMADLTQRLEEEAQQLAYAQHVQLQLDKRRHLSRTLQEVFQDDARAPHTGGGMIGGRLDADDSGMGSTRSAGMMIGALSAEDEERLAAYQRAFRAMMQAARVDRIEDLVAAFEEEHASHDHLARSVAEARETHRQLAEEVKLLRRRREAAVGVAKTTPSVTDTVSATGATTTAASVAPISKKMLDELRTFVREEELELRRRIAANEADEQLLMELARRTDLLSDKVSAYLPDVVIPATAESTLLEEGGPKGSATLLGHLTVLKHKLLALVDEVGHSPGRTGHNALAIGGGSGSETRVAAPVRSTQFVIPANNVRVNLSSRRTGTGGTAEPTTTTVGAMGGATGVAGGDSNASRVSLLQDAMNESDAMAAAGEGDSGLLLLAASAADGTAVYFDGEDDIGKRAGSAASSPPSTSMSASSSSRESGVAATGGGGEHNKSGAIEASGGGESAAASRATAPEGEAKPVQRRWDRHRDDPLSREEVKQLSAAVQQRERRRRERERLVGMDGE